LVAHRVWFGQDSFAQGSPDEIVIRQPDVLEEAKWRQERFKHAMVKPAGQKQTELNELSHLKKKDLFEVGEIMSREPGDFKKRYPNPDEGRNARSQIALFEELQEVRRILWKVEQSWTSAKYYELLCYGR
jgi:hypothetical protein